MKTSRSQIIKSMLLPLADKIMGTCISSSLKRIGRMQKLSMDEIRLWQNEQLYQLIEYAYTHTRYYNKLFNDLGLHPSNIKTIDDLKKIPILTKEIIRENFEELITDEIQSINHKKAATGGSSGDPLVFLLDNKSWSYSSANKIFNWEKVGYIYGEKYIALGSTSLYVNKRQSFKHKLYYKLNGKIGLNGINMSDETCKHYLTIIHKRKIRFIYGYASAIYLLAKYAIRTRNKPSIIACFPTSEILTEEYRNVIIKAFQCKVMDCYGASDGGITAFSNKQGYYEVGYNCIVRLNEIDKLQNSSAILTDLYNYAMPLINYRIGDELKIDVVNNKEYQYNGQVINQVLGRSSDIILLNNGRTLTGPGFTILFKDIPAEYYCIEKTTPGSIVCWIIKLQDYSNNHEKAILQTLKNQTGDDISIEIRYINNPFLSKSGKRQYFIDQA